MGLVEKLPVAFTNTNIPKLPRHALVKAGTKFLFDFKAAYTFPSQNLPGNGSTLANGTVLTNMVDGAPTALISGTPTYSSGGGIVLNGTGQNIDLGNTYDLYADNSPEFLFSVWFLQDDNYSTTNYQALGGRILSSSAGNAQGALDLGVGGRLIRGTAGSATATVTQGVASGNTHTLNVAHQAAVAWEGGQVKTFRDNTLMGSSALAGPLANVAANWKLGTAASFGSFKGKLFFASLEYLGQTGRTAAQAVAADYAFNTGRFS